MKVGDTWIPFWRAYLQCHFTSRSTSGIKKCVSKLHATVALYAPDDVVGRGIKIRPAAMMVEFKFFTMRGYRGHNRLCCCLSAFKGRGGQDTAHDHAREGAKAATEGGA